MVKVKICGFTTPEDARTACDCGADMIGVISRVTVSTPRELSFLQARKILGAVPEGIDTVAVSMPRNLEEAKVLDEELDTDYLQVHSPLSRPELQRIKEEIRKKIIGVFSVPEEFDEPEELISQAQEIAQASDILLIDTHSDAGGGTGRVHDWTISREIVEALDTPVILAGGLGPSNVQRAIKEVSPHGVDVASGVEAEPGRKSPELIKEFIGKASEIKVDKID